MNVPFLDLHAQHAPHREEFREAIEAVIDASAFAGGGFVDRFEAQFAAYCGARFAVGVGSGTEALWLSLLAMGVGPGDEVITSPSSFVATAEAICMAGATPVFVDIEEDTYTLDPRALRSAITPRTKVIIPVHLFGQSADLDAIREVAEEAGLRVLEDAAQAHGAACKGQRIGSTGDAACFSFYPGKNLGAFGDAGAVTTNDVELYDRLRALRDHGQTRKHHHTTVGWTGRMDGIQAAVLSAKLPRLDEGNARRRAHAARYRELLRGADGLILPSVRPDREHVYHIFAIRVGERDEVRASLDQEGIATAIHYPLPIHLQEAYSWLGYRPGSFPVAERCASEFLSLPMFPELRADQVEQVAEALLATLSSNSVS